MKRIVFLLLFLVSPVVFAQEEHKSIMQREWEYYRAHEEEVGKGIVVTPLAKRSDLAKVTALSHVVYGFHPYWQNGSESNYYFSLLTHLVYFSGDIDTSNGGFSSTHLWSSANVVSLAQSYGIKVHFAVTLFSGHSAILNNNTKRQALINNIITQINVRSADGCNVDFEGVSSTLKDSLRTFIVQLGTALHAVGKELVVELPAVDWSSGWVVFGTTFFSATSFSVDYYFLMAYDYYWSGSPNAGPVAPLRASSVTIEWHSLRSIDTYKAKGCPANKLIAGYPYYGYDWPTVDTTLLSATTASGNSRTYTVVKNNYIDTIPASHQYWNTTYNTRWYFYNNGTSWRECWYDDSLSLSMKYDSTKAKNIAGTGMWALGYDGTETELWGALKRAFASSPNVSYTSLDNFETGTGHFNQLPTYSGSTVGISKLSTSVQSNDAANNGCASLQVVLKDSTSVSTNWTVRLVSGSGNRTNNVQMSNTGYVGFWMKTSSAPGGSQVALTIDDERNGSIDKTELSSKQNVLNDGEWHLYEWVLPGSGWTSFASGNGTLDSAVVSLDAIMFYAPNASPDWTLYLDDVSYNNLGSLPVELASFIAQVKENTVELRWSTATEINTAGFIIERRNDLVWRPIGYVAGIGTTNIPHTHVFTDASVTSGIYIYRLKQIDTDGAFKYSHTVEISLSVPASFALYQNYPNPFNPETKIEYEIPPSPFYEKRERGGFVKLAVYDLLGRELAVLVNEEKPVGRYTISWNAVGMSSGIYFYRLQAGTYSETKKMILTR